MYVSLYYFNGALSEMSVKSYSFRERNDQFSSGRILRKERSRTRRLTREERETVDFPRVYLSLRDRHHVRATR